jgi:hypothetical protein
MWPSVKYTRSTTTSTWLSNPLYRLHNQAGTSSHHSSSAGRSAYSCLPIQKTVEARACYQGSVQHMSPGSMQCQTSSKLYTLLQL